MTLSQEIAEYIFRTRYEDLPGSVISKAKDCIIDTIGVSLYGSKFEASKIALSVISQSTEREQAGTSVLGKRKKIFPPLAAFVNGIMAHVADFDDVLTVLRGHPSCVVLPSSLAACESAGKNGKDLLTSFVIGVEVAAKLGSLISWEQSMVGWHVTGTIGTIAAVAAASKGLALSVDKITNAIGISASSASGLRVNFGSMTKSYHAGHAAMMGVLASELAEKGFDSSPTSLEDDQGFAKVFGYSGEISSFTELPGKDYALNNIILKPYPSCAGTHTAIDAILRIRDQNRFELKDIMEIDAYVPPSLLNVTFHHNPSTNLEAKFSLEYCISSALIFGRVGIDQFEGDSVENPEVRGLMRRVKIIPEPEMESSAREKGVLSPARVHLRLRDGKEFSEMVWEAKGGPSNPMSRDEIRDKFKRCARGILSDSNIEETLNAIEHLETVERVSDLTSIIQEDPQ